MIEFGDGKKMDIGGETRVVERDGEWFVAGNGFMFPADSEEEAGRLLVYIEAKGMYVAMKLFKSPRLRREVADQLAAEAAAAK